MDPRVARYAVLGAFAAACSGGASAPQPVANTAPHAAPRDAAEAPSQICEPTVACGDWSGCVWLDRIDATTYREVHGTRTFRRQRECYPDDTRRSANCAVYCRDGHCVDGLHPVDETCTGASVPHPSSLACLIGAGICGSLM